MRLTEREHDRLFDAVFGHLPAPTADEQTAVRHVYRILAAGQPVTAATLAARSGWDQTRSRNHLDRLANVDRDNDEIVGFGGLTLQPTPHRITVDGHVLSTWCAWDTLFLPVALDTHIAVASTCPATGRPVTLTVGPGGVIAKDPERVVLSFVRPEAIDAADLRGSFCGHVHFYADPDAAAAHTAHHPDRFVLDLDDGYEIGRRMIVARCGVGAAQPPTPQ